MLGFFEDTVDKILSDFGRTIVRLEELAVRNTREAEEARATLERCETESNRATEVAGKLRALIGADPGQ